MRIHLISDIHLEFKPYIFPKKVPDCDIGVVAGDISNFAKREEASLFLRNCRNWLKKPIFFVLGNHDYYLSENFNSVQNYWREEEKKDEFKNIYYLEKDSYSLEINNEKVKILGTTLWSNLSENFSSFCNDKNKIGNYLPQVREEFKKNVEWLETELKDKSSSDGVEEKIIIITHYMPSFRLVHPDYSMFSKGEHSNFASDLDYLFKAQHLTAWLYGHTHKLSINTLDGVKFFCNPRGYPGEESGFRAGFRFSV